MKKNGFLLFICFAVLTSISYSQQNEIEKSTPLFSIEQNGKFGYIDKTGKVINEPKYDQDYMEHSFTEGLVMVKIGEKFGYIDKTGKVVIEPEFDAADSFTEGLAKVKIGEKYGYIDKAGKVVIEPKYDRAYPFTEGIAHVMIGKKIGYIDKTGKYIIDPQFTFANPFSEGLALTGKGGYGSSFEFVGGFRAILKSGTSKTKMWFIDKTGEIAIDLQIHEVKEIVLPGFSEGLAAVKIGNKWGFVDKTGKVVIEPKFDIAWSFSEGLARVKINNKYCYIDKTGKYVWEPTN